MQFWYMDHWSIDIILPLFVGIKFQKSSYDPMQISGPCLISYSPYSMPMFRYLCILSTIQRVDVQYQIIIYKDVHDPTTNGPNVKLSYTDIPGMVGRGIVGIFVHENIGGSLEHQTVDHRHNIIKYKKYEVEHGIRYIDKCKIFVGILQQKCIFCIGS